MIEGDSITSTDPQQTSNQDSFYSYTWTNAQTGITAFVTAKGSRQVGGAAYNGDLAQLPSDENSLWQQRNNDLALTPHLVTAKIGVNDLSSTGIQVATYIQRLKDWGAAIKAGGAKVAYASPTPVEVRAGINQASYDFYMGKWNTLWTTHNVRNPANWSQWADYYIPMGEHPDFLLGNHTTDGVHLTAPATNPTTGQGKLLAIYSAAMATLRDPTRVNSAGPYQSVWDAFGPFTNLEAGATITRRVILSGLAWAGRSEGVSVTGASGSPSVKTNGKTAPGYTYNGDVIDLTLTLSSSYETDRSIDLTIGGETRTLTFRTAANVAPVTESAVFFDDLIGEANNHDYQVNFPAAGRYVAFAYGPPNSAVSLIYDPTNADPDADANVTATALTHSIGEYGQRVTVFMLDVPAAGTEMVRLAFTAYTSQSVLCIRRIENADPTPVAVFPASPGLAPANENNPHETSAGNVPANGLFIGALCGEELLSVDPATVPGVHTGTTLVVQGTFDNPGQSIRAAMVVGKRGAGTNVKLGFNYKFGAFGRAGVIFKANGT